ncbi:DUF2975 domain-containing protein [Ideonella sp. DXS29W]|uniref:DUF2975 domain-containing protein n=1 Tax=Ideonella lacteola TaxID=2984193 RepID=A0ABU9BHJ7_9BURK
MISPSTAPRASALPLTVRLRRLSRWIRGLSLVAGLLLLATPLMVLLIPETLMDAGFQQIGGLDMVGLSQDGLTLAVRTRLALVTLWPVGIGLGLMWQLWSLFGEYLKGNVFGQRALTCLHRFSALLLALSITIPLSHVLLSVAVSWDNPPGQRQLIVSISSNDYALVLGALVFLAIARVMGEAARVAEENEGFV